MVLRYNFCLFYNLQKKKTGTITFHYVNNFINQLYGNGNHDLSCDSIWWDEKKGEFDFCGAAVLVPYFYDGKYNLTTNDIHMCHCMHEV